MTCKQTCFGSCVPNCTSHIQRLYIQQSLRRVVLNDVGETDTHLYTFFHYLIKYKRHIFVNGTNNYTDFLLTL